MTRHTSPEHDLTKGFSVGEWEIRPLAGTFRRGDHAVHVEPKVMDVLLCLARRPGEIVTRDELLAAVWNGVVVTDDVLTRCVSELRTLLGDTDRERRYIRTIPKRGYSLIAPIGQPESRSDASAAVPVGARLVIDKGVDLARGTARLVRNVVYGAIAVIALITVGLVMLVNQDDVEVVITDDNGEAAVSGAAESVEDIASGARPPAQEPMNSLAVLPFVNLSDQVEHAFFSDGLSEDIRNALITGTDLRVAGRTSSRAFQKRAVDIREIGRQLNVDALLEGTVRIVGERLRVTAQLTDASDGYPLWAASYDRELGDKMQSQVALAGQIVQALASELETVARPLTRSTANLAAHEFYLLGRHHWHQRTPESLEQAIAYFTQALALDSNYALAYSGLADAHLFQISYAGRPVEEALAAGRDYAIRALELGPELAEAHASMGIVYEHSWQLDRARQAYQRAVELQPRYSMAQMWLGNVWFAQEDVNRAHDHYSTALELDPLHPQVQYNYVNILMAGGRYDEAQAALERFRRFSENEKLTEEMLAVAMHIGRYDQVLTTAVQHTFAGSFTPYNNRPVIESLIYMGRLDEAEQMIRDNADAMKGWQLISLRASLALARRDSEALHRIAEEALKTGPKVNYVAKHACSMLWSEAWHGVADFIARDYQAAAARLSALVDIEAPEPCADGDPELRLGVMNYLAASRLKLNPEDARARQLLDDAREEIASLRSRGWGTAQLTLTEAATRRLGGDDAGAAALLADVQSKGWQLYGRLRFSPLFDGFDPETAGDESLQRLAQGFESMEAEFENIGLKKLGL